MLTVLAFSIEDCWRQGAPVPVVGAPLAQRSSCSPHSLLPGSGGTSLIGEPAGKTEPEGLAPSYLFFLLGNSKKDML